MYIVLLKTVRCMFSVVDEKAFKGVLIDLKSI